jgi:hypothetical protein
MGFMHNLQMFRTFVMEMFQYFVVKKWLVGADISVALFSCVFTDCRQMFRQNLQVFLLSGWVSYLSFLLLFIFVSPFYGLAFPIFCSIWECNKNYNLILLFLVYILCSDSVLRLYQ